MNAPNRPRPGRRARACTRANRGPTLDVQLLEDRTTPGAGTFKNGLFNFCVSVRFNATNAQLDQIRTAFQNASQILADATDGQHRFGEITIVNNSGASQSSEFWVNAGPGRAVATYGEYGGRGKHINLYLDDDFQAKNGGADGDAFTIAHEFAHHAYGLGDEYSGPLDPDATQGTKNALVDTATLNYSLMDNFFTRGGRAFGGGYTLDEFSVPSNHDLDDPATPQNEANDTYQSSIHNGQSDWETVAASRYPATAPAGLPVAARPAAHTVTFKQGVSGLRAMILLDRSGSMASEDRLVFAKLGGNVFADLIEDGDGLGVASFSSDVSVDYFLTSVNGQAIRDGAKAAINALNASDTTNIGGGLQAALGQLTSQAVESCDEVIILLSDGDHNTGTDPSAVIPALKDAGVTVLTIGVGAGISSSGQATLQNIAAQTGGRYYSVSDSADLQSLFLQLTAETQGSGLLARAPLTIGSNQINEVPVLIESGAIRATFAAAIEDRFDDLTLSLRSPSGVTITAADATTNPNVKFLSNSNLRLFQVNAPQPGIWRLVASSGNVGTGQLDMVAYTDNDGVQLSVSVANDTPVFPEPVLVRATPLYRGAPVVGANLAGSVVRPDGSRVPIRLFDDGLSTHGDAVAGDGIYANTFNNYQEGGNGTYSFELTAATTGAMTFAGEQLFAAAPSSAKTVPAFIRLAGTTAVVTGVPFQIDRADLGVVQNASTRLVLPGEMFSYTINVSNQGPDDATDVLVTDALPSGVQLVSITATGGGVRGGTATAPTIRFADLASGSSATITVRVAVRSDVVASSRLGNRVFIASGTSDLVPDNNSSLVTIDVSGPRADLSIRQEASTSASVSGSTIVYTLIVTNTGPDPATDIILTDTLTAGLSLVSFSAPGGISGGTAAAPSLRFASLAAGASATATLVARVDPGTARGTVLISAASVQASGNNDPTPSNDSASRTVLVGSVPRITSLQRIGSRGSIKGILLAFDAPLDPSRAQSLANYRLIGPGKDRKLGNRDDRPVKLKSASYDPVARAVTLRPNKALSTLLRYQLIASGAGLADPEGNALDGNGDGLPGGDYSARFRGLGAKLASTARDGPAEAAYLQTVPKPDAQAALGQAASAMTNGAWRRLLSPRRGRAGR